MTQGLDTILEARQVLLVVKGADKAGIPAAAFNGAVTSDCPASVPQLHPHLPVVADEGRCRAIASISRPGRRAGHFRASANQPVMVAGCVIAVPTTTAKAPASRACRAWAGV
ncbi:UNVERIFIED_CONTAM: hypothetical protein Q9R71_23760 [Actinomycetes bacterium ARC8]|nr:hypothetical protein [Actinomycetes bacterium ARC8]